MEFLKNIYVTVRNFIARNIVKAINFSQELIFTVSAKKNKGEKAGLVDWLKTIGGCLLAVGGVVAFYTAVYWISYGVGFAAGYVFSLILPPVAAVIIAMLVSILPLTFFFVDVILTAEAMYFAKLATDASMADNFPAKWTTNYMYMARQTAKKAAAHFAPRTEEPVAA